MKKIYLAGPDVFKSNAKKHLDELKALCAKYGYEGLSPLDNVPMKSSEPSMVAASIYVANLAMIDSADIVMANLNDWQGEPDSGTSFEVGYARAKGKEIWTYRDEAAGLCEWEEFGGPVNLMLWCSAVCVWGNAEDCLLRILANDR